MKTLQLKPPLDGNQVTKSFLFRVKEVLLNFALFYEQPRQPVSL